MRKFKVGDKVVVREACTGIMELLRDTQGVRKYYIITRTCAGSKSKIVGGCNVLGKRNNPRKKGASFARR